jgi:prepilin peptidase CpaA
MPEVFILSIPPAALLFAAHRDITTMTIPNWLSIVLVAAFPIAALGLGQPVAVIGWHLAFGLVLFAAGAGLFSLGMMGGGDVKIIAAAGVWMGAAVGFTFLVWTAVAGGVLALVVYAARRAAGRFFGDGRLAEPDWVCRLMKGGEGVPYAVAIAVGGIMAWPQSPIAQAALKLA